MRISVTIFVILISTYIVNASVLDPVIENVVHLKASKPPSPVPGIWKKKTIWKPRWVKEWKSAKVMKPVWRKVWSPVQIREWVPIPKPPPGWDFISTPLVPVQSKPQKVFIKNVQKAPPKDSLGHDSFAVHSSTKVPLWDPVPYPESQQPPPLPFLPQPLYNADVACGKNYCDNAPSQTFTHSQISEIIGPRYQTPEYYQNPEHSETVNHLTKLSPDGNSWRPHQNFHLDHRFSFQGPPEFLVPPKFQSLPEHNFPFPSQSFKSHPSSNSPLSHSPEADIQNSFRQWIPFPPDNKIKGHFITKPLNQAQHKFQTPSIEINDKNNTNVKEGLFHNSNDYSQEKFNTRPQKATPGTRADGDFIQEAQLIGEYHYSNFDLPDLNKPLPTKEKEEIGAKPQQLSMENKPEINYAAKQSDLRRPENQQKHAEVRINHSEVRNPPDSTRVQKKHISSTPNLTNFNQKYQPQEAIIKEIFPIYKTPQNANLSLLNNHRTTTPTPRRNQEKAFPMNDSSIKMPVPVANTSDVKVNVQHQKEFYPVLEIPKNANPIFIPPSNLFQPQGSPMLSNSTRLKPVKSESASIDKTSSVELVFATTSDDYNSSTENFQKTTTTEPYEIIFSSSLSTAEPATKSSVIIVTPANTKS